MSMTRVALILIMLTTVASTQTTIQGGTWGAPGAATQSFTIGVTAGAGLFAPTPAMPIVFPNDMECIGTTTWTLQFPGSGGWIGPNGTPAGWPTALPYANTAAGFLQAVNDMESYRTANGTSTLLLMPAGSSFTQSSVFVIPQTSNTQAAACNMIQSATPNLAGQTVCFHGPQDNLPTALNPGLENADCAGDALSYYLGATQTTISGTNALWNDAANMWSLSTSGSNANVLQTCSPTGAGATLCAGNIGPDHWMISDLNAFSPVGSLNNSLVINIDGSRTETLPSQLPSHIHLKRVWVHGDWTTLTAGANQMSSGLVMGCIYCSATDFAISQGLRPGGEGHGITFGYGSQIKLANFWQEGSAIGLLNGGFSGSGPTIANYVTGQDLEFRRGRSTFPYSWLGVLTVPGGNANWAGQSLSRKNSYEQKEGQRQVGLGLILENVDNSGGQGGPTNDWTVRNSSSGSGTNFQSVVSDVYFYGNLARNACNGFQLDSRSDGSGNGNGASQAAHNFWIRNNLWYNITNTNPGCGGANSTGNAIGSSTNKWKGTVSRDLTGTLATFILTCTTDVGGNCPAGPLPTGYTQSNINIGDYVEVTGCTSDASFNTTTYLVGGTPVPILGTPALLGTVSTGATVVFANAGTPSAFDSSGNCLISNVQGWPLNFLYTHNTIVTDSTRSLATNANIPSGAGPNYARYSLIRDSIWLGGGWLSAVGEGTAVETFNYDSTTATIDHLVWPTRTAASYTEFGNNPNYPDASCITPGGCNPPVSHYFPTTPYCAGNTPSTSCVGFFGAMSQGLMPLVLTDWHNYRLCTAGDAACNSTKSVFAAGGSQQASDGTDMGPNMSLIDSAQTNPQFICPYGGCSGYQDSPQVYVLQFYTNATLPWWNNANGGIIQVAQTPANTAIAGVTVQVWWSDIDDQLSGTVSVTNNSTAATLTCTANCTNQSQMNGWLINGVYYDGTISGNAITLATPYEGSTSGSVAVQAYNFTYPDSLTTGWYAAGKQVNFVAPMAVASTGASDTTNNAQNYGATGVGNRASPANLWTLLTAANYVSCTAGGVGQRTPNWVNATFQTQYKNAITAFYTHFARKRMTRYIRIPLGHGGESLPAPTWNSGTDLTCKNYWQTQLGSTNITTEVTNWFNNWTSVVLDFGLTLRGNVWARVRRNVQLMGGLTPMNGNQLADLIAPRAVTDLWGFGSQGLAASDVNNCAGSTADWCALFNTWSAKVPTQLQTVGLSCPAGITCTGNQSQTGPLPAVLNYAAGKQTQIFELYWNDTLLAFSPVVGGYCTAANGANYTQAQCNVIQPAYASVVNSTASAANSLYNAGP